MRVPSESAGLLRRPASWSAVSQASLAFGYELLITSVQLVAAYGSLANGGVLMRPTLVREIRDFNGEATWRSVPEAVRRVVHQDVASQVTEVLTWVVSEEGTGRRAALETLSIAGKTGTARIASKGGYDDRRYAASFVGFAPADDPRLVILTKLEDPQGQYFGGGIAAPVSRRVLQAMLAGEDAGLMDGAGPKPDGAARTFPESDLDWSRTTSSGVERRSLDAGPRAGSLPPSVFRFAANGESAVHEFEWTPDSESELAEVSVPDVRGLDVRHEDLLHGRKALEEPVGEILGPAVAGGALLPVGVAEEAEGAQGLFLEDASGMIDERAYDVGRGLRRELVVPVVAREDRGAQELDALDHRSAGRQGFVDPSPAQRADGLVRVRAERPCDLAQSARALL